MLRESMLAGDVTDPAAKVNARAALQAIVDRLCVVPVEEIPAGWEIEVARASNELRLIPESGDHDLRIECLLWIGRGFAACGQARFVIDVAEEAIQLATQIGDLRRLRLAWGLSGIGAGLCGDVQTSVDRTIRSVEVALVLAREHGEWNHAAAALSNLACEALRADRVEEALVVAEEAESLVVRCVHDGLLERELAARILQMNRVNQAEALARLDRLDESIDVSERLIRDGPALTRHRRIHAETGLISALVRRGHLEKARRYLDPLLALRGAGDMPEYRVYPDLVEGLVRVHEGDATGFTLVDRARDLARTFPHLYVDVLRALVLCDATGLRRDSGEPLREFLSVTRRHRQQGLAIGRRLQRGVRATLENGEASGTLRRMAIVATLAEEPSGEHPFRVAELSRRMAQQLGLPVSDVDAIADAALLHDVGKCLIPSEVLSRKMAWRDERESIVRSHADAGAELILLADLDDATTACDIARHHHERWDGTGFPDRLKGAAIPLPARIVALADRFDVLIAPRHGAAVLDSAAALRAVEAESGTAFSPKIVEALSAVLATLPPTADALRAVLSASAAGSVALEAVMSLRRLASQAHG